MIKKIAFTFVLFLAILAFCYSEGIVDKAAAGNQKSDMSYAFGMILASDFLGSGMEFNYPSLLRGFREVLEDKDTLFTMDEAMDIAQTAYQAAMEKQADLNRQEELAFLTANGERDGVITTDTGLQYEVLVEGSGDQPLFTDFVRVNYQGALTDGTIFDSSYDRGEPEDFPLQGVIPGFSEGILLMKEGGKSRLFIPSNLAYGARGIGGISPYSTLVFEVELLEIIEAPEDDFFPDDEWDWELEEG